MAISRFSRLALNCLVFVKIEFLCTHFGDRQTDTQIDWTDPMHKGALAIASGALIM